MTVFLFRVDPHSKSKTRTSREPKIYDLTAKQMPQYRQHAFFSFNIFLSKSTCVCTNMKYRYSITIANYTNFTYPYHHVVKLYCFENMVTNHNTYNCSGAETYWSFLKVCSNEANMLV